MRLVLAALWIVIGGAITAGAYWGFLITPESTIWTLMVSALLAIVVLALAGLTAAGAIAIWSHGVSLAAARRTVRAIPAVVPAAIVVALVWWLTNRAEAWVVTRSGGINAWFIARLGWDDVQWIFSAVHFIGLWFKWVIGGMLALSMMAAVVNAGWPAIAAPAWLRRALHPRALALATVAFVALIALPWMFLVPWRPRNLPPTSIEYVFIVSKLALSAMLFAVGAALMVGQASPVPATLAPRAPAQAPAAVI
jgi:hypothetical protein